MTRQNLSWSVCVSCSGKPVNFLAVLTLAVTCGCTTAVSNGQSPTTPSHESITTPKGSSPRPDNPQTAKIASPIRQVWRRMQDDGLTAANVATSHPESYSTPLVRVDPLGRLQIMLLVTHLDTTVETTLITQKFYIEHIDHATQSLQGWLPFTHLEAVTTLSFVRYMRPPRYAYTR